MAIKSKKVDWAKLIVGIQDKLIMSQAEIADHCGVVRQCVSNWKIGYRLPGYHAKRKLLELKTRVDIESKIKGNPLYRNKTADPVIAYSIDDISDDRKMLSAISNIFKTLDAMQKREVLEFVIFKAEKSPSPVNP